jgi:membrane protein YqaA with SNARE-associated domain
MSGLTGLSGLFLVAFASATLLPAQSEALLAGMAIADLSSPLALLAVASAGNTLGSCVNWWIGLQADRLRGRRWFPVGDAALLKARRSYARWGWPSLLLAWVPIVGDPLTLAAGVMREPLWRFLAVVGVAKTARYAAVIAMAEAFAG